MLQRQAQPNRLCYNLKKSLRECPISPLKTSPCVVNPHAIGGLSCIRKNALSAVASIYLGSSYSSRYRCVSSVDKQPRRNSPRYVFSFHERAGEVTSAPTVGADSTTASSGFSELLVLFENFCEIHFLTCLSCHATLRSRWRCTRKAR